MEDGSEMIVTRHRNGGYKARLGFLFTMMLIKPVLVLWPTSDIGLRLLRWFERGHDRIKDVRGTVRSRITLPTQPADLFVPSDTNLASTDTALLYLHGGGFIGCSPTTHRKIAGLLARELRVPVYSLEYRLLPDFGVGASVDDAVLAYRQLLQGYRQVVVAGDSAGGFLSAKVIEYAHAHGLPKPVAYIGYSPLLDLKLGSNPARTSRRDAYISKYKMVALTPKWERGPIAFPGERSILMVPPEAFPPTLLITAQAELLEPDTIQLAHNLSAAGCVVDLHSFAWQLHAFPAIALSHATAEAVLLSADFARQALEPFTPAPNSEQAG